MEVFRGLSMYKRDEVESGYESDDSMTWAPLPPPCFSRVPADYTHLERDLWGEWEEVNK